MNLFAFSQLTQLAVSQNAEPQGSLLMNLLPFALIFVIFYFLLILPQKKQQKKIKEMINNLQKGDRVLLQSGMYGRIVEFKDNDVKIEIAPKVIITVQKAVIISKVSEEVSSQ